MDVMTRIALLAATAAAALSIASPAFAGEWWRSCGGIRYEGCDGISRGPYAHFGRRGHGYGGGHRGYGGVVVIPRGQIAIPSGQIIINRATGGGAFFRY
jgi:hypothetical protein